MYRDNTLIPSEAIRLLALGILADGDRRYAELASEVRNNAQVVNDAVSALESEIKRILRESRAGDRREHER